MEKELRDALQALVVKLEAMTPEVDAIIAFAFTHNIKYRGPSIEAELKRAKEVLANSTRVAV